MIEEWLSFSELCERWKINEYTLAKLVIDGKLRSHNKDFLEICVTDDGWFVDSPDGHGMLIHEPLTVDEVVEHIFRISHIEEKEKDEFSAAWDEAAKKSPIIDVIRWLESQKPRDVTEWSLKLNGLSVLKAKLAKIEGDKSEDNTEKNIYAVSTITPPDSTIKKVGEDKANTVSEEGPATFIRSLQVFYVDNTEVKIQYKGKRKNYTCESIGFRDSRTKEWQTFLEILQNKDYAYRLGPAHSIKKEIHQKVRINEYDKKRKLLQTINRKLIYFLTQQYKVTFPPKFKLYKPEPNQGPGVYSFKFHIPLDKPSYKTKDQTLRYVELLTQQGASKERTQQAVLAALAAGASRDEVSDIVKDMLPSQPEYTVTTDEQYSGNELEEDE